MGENGGIIGPDNVPTTTVASGLWTLAEVADARGAGIWPFAGAGTIDPLCSSVPASGIGRELSVSGTDFSGTSDWHTSGVRSSWIVGNRWAMWAVAKFDLAGSDDHPSGGGQRQIVGGLAGVLGLGLGSSKMIGFTWGTPTICEVAATTGIKYGIEFYGDGTNNVLTVSGVGSHSQSFDAPSTSGEGTDTIWIGKYQTYAADYFDGTLYDLFGLPGVSSAQRLAIRTELANLHGFAW